MTSTGDESVTERSEELRSITLRYLAAIDRGDVDAMNARSSRTADLTALGTFGPPIRGPERNKRYTEVEFEAVGRYPVPDPEVEAWVRGDVGWSFGIAKVGEDGRDEVRFSFVLQLEQDDWKIVFAHVSIAEREDSEAWAVPFDQEISELLAKILSEEPPDLSGSAAPDGTVTLVFTDIESSTALNASFGDKAWLDVLHAHNQVVTSVTLKLGGTVVKGVGDGFMLAFTSARTALAASQEIEDRIAETFDDPGSPIRKREGPGRPRNRDRAIVAVHLGEAGVQVLARQRRRRSGYGPWSSLRPGTR